MKALLAAIAASAAALVLASVAYAEDLSDMDTFVTAGAFYEDGNYEEAARTYEHLVGLGYRDATLYYNLANAYYKSEDAGHAILNYLRASRLAPFDEDIEANLSFVREQLDSPNSREATTPAFVQISEFVPWITFNQAAIVTLSSWFVLGLLCVLYLWVRRFRKSVALGRVAAVAILCIFVFGSVTIGKHMERLHWEQVVVVISEETGVFHGPRDSGDPRFILDAGSEVRLIEARGAWWKIGIFDTGVEGWIAGADAETVLSSSG